MAEQSGQSGSEINPRQAGDLSPQFDTTPDDLEDDGDVERVELLAADAAGRKRIEEDELGEKLNELAVTTEEEVDALKVNLLQDDEPPSTEDGTGRVVDDVAEERLARFTEADPMQSDLGAISVAPGLDNTSAVLRRHHPNTEIARFDALVEGNLDEPMDETINDPKVDVGTGS